MAFQEDLDQFFSDFAVSATVGSETAQVLFDAPDAMIADAMVITAEYLITYPVGTFAGLEGGDTVTVDGDNYEAHQPMKKDDGKLMVCRLTKL